MATKKAAAAPVKEPAAMPMLADYLVPKPDIQAHSVCTMPFHRVRYIPYAGKSGNSLPLQSLKCNALLISHYYTDSACKLLFQ